MPQLQGIFHQKRQTSKIRSVLNLDETQIQLLEQDLPALKIQTANVHNRRCVIQSGKTHNAKPNKNMFRRRLVSSRQSGHVLKLDEDTICYLEEQHEQQIERKKKKYVGKSDIHHILEGEHLTEVDATIPRITDDELCPCNGSVEPSWQRQLTTSSNLKPESKKLRSTLRRTYAFGRPISRTKPRIRSDILQPRFKQSVHKTTNSEIISGKKGELLSESQLLSMHALGQHEEITIEENNLTSELRSLIQNVHTNSPVDIHINNSKKSQTEKRSRNVRVMVAPRKNTLEKETQKDEKILTRSSPKLDKSTQMVEYVTEREAYCIEWIHKNLFEVIMNPFHLIADEKIMEPSEITCWGSEKKIPVTELLSN